MEKLTLIGEILFLLEIDSHGNKDIEIWIHILWKQSKQSKNGGGVFLPPPSPLYGRRVSIISDRVVVLYTQPQHPSKKGFALVTLSLMLNTIHVMMSQVKYLDVMNECTQKVSIMHSLFMFF